MSPRRRLARGGRTQRCRRCGWFLTCLADGLQINECCGCTHGSGVLRMLSLSVAVLVRITLSARVCVQLSRAVESNHQCSCATVRGRRHRRRQLARVGARLALRKPSVAQQAPDLTPTRVCSGSMWWPHLWLLRSRQSAWRPRLPGLQSTSLLQTAPQPGLPTRLRCSAPSVHRATRRIQPVD